MAEFIRSGNGKFNISKIVGQADKILKDTAQKEARSFRRNWQTWDEKPTIRIIKIKEGYALVIDSVIWGFVNFGTKPHTIAPRGYGNGGTDPYTGKKVKGSDYLRYQPDFTPKTSPNRIGAKEGGKRGAYWQFEDGQSVQHTGVEPRLFHEKILEKQPERLANSIYKMMLNQTK